MSKSVLLCISTLLDGGNHYSKMCASPVVEDGSRRNLQGLDSRSHPLARARRFNLSDSLGRPLFANIQISLVCAACLKTDEPEKCVSIQTRAAVRHSLSRSLCRFAGARTSSPRCGTTKLSEKRARPAPTLFPSSQMPRWLSSNKMVRTFFSCHMHAILSLNAHPRSVYRKS